LKAKPKRQFNSFIRFSAIGTEMLGAILLCAWLGSWLDKTTQTSQPYWTIGWMLFGVFSSIFLLLRNLKTLEENEKNDNLTQKKDE
jgi:F0F1-type ATP synthase assembly protein I